MSNDRKMLEALQKTVNKIEETELRHFEQVQYWRGSRQMSSGDRAYLCVGKSALYFVSMNLKKVKPYGTIEYSMLDRVVEDTLSHTSLMIVTKSSFRPDMPSRVYLSLENRSALLNRLAVCYLADTICRTGEAALFPKYEQELGHVNADQDLVNPFEEYKAVNFQDYRFFLKQRFEDVTTATAKKESGLWRGPAFSILSNANTDDDRGDIEVSVHVYDPVSLMDLDKIGREHIRWVALEYKQALIKDQKTQVIRNALYTKKMNLSNDPAAWSCWEVLMKDTDQITFVVLLRRQYVPPLMDSAQDFAIIFKCPAALGNNKVPEHGLMHEAHIAADTFGPRVQHMMLYPDIIQAKLDSLLYDEDAYAWIRSRLRLRPQGETQLEVYAYIFMKGILKIIADENALTHPQLWDEVAQRVMVLCQKKTEYDLDPMVVAISKLKKPKEGTPKSSQSSTDEDKNPNVNGWQARVAKYLAYCVDGGLLGNKFTLADMVSNVTNSTVCIDAANKLTALIAFLLHMRPKDLSKPWVPEHGLHHQFELLKYNDFTFNDRVMQVLLELGFVKSLYPPRREDKEWSRGYCEILSRLLQSDVSSINLKASICRQIIAVKDMDHGTSLCPGLMQLMRDGGLFLGTYACAALINLSQAKEVVKSTLMQDGIAEICVLQLKSRDDDLVLYTLMLLVHLTKLVHHRAAVRRVGVIHVCINILNASEEHVGSAGHKKRQVTELCSVFGQLCNDEKTRKKMCDKYRIVDVCLEIFEKAEKVSRLTSKLMFLLKQLCANAPDIKNTVGQKVIKSIVSDLGNPENLKNLDWATNAITLLVTLTLSRNNCTMIRELRGERGGKSGWDVAYKALQSSPLGTMDATRDRIRQISERIEDNKEATNGGQ